MHNTMLASYASLRAARNPPPTWSHATERRRKKTTTRQGCELYPQITPQILNAPRRGDIKRQPAPLIIR